MYEPIVPEDRIISPEREYLAQVDGVADLFLLEVIEYIRACEVGGARGEIRVGGPEPNSEDRAIHIDYNGRIVARFTEHTYATGNVRQRFFADFRGMVPRSSRLQQIVNRLSSSTSKIPSLTPESSQP